MKIQALKISLLFAVLFGLLAGCSSTPSTEETTGDVTTVEDEGVATGTVDDGGISGDTYDDAAASADTVFYFDFDKSVLKPEAMAALRIHAESLRNNPRAIRLEGHADERGTREYNMALGERRANSVKEFLMLEGVNGSYIDVISYGEERPASLDSNEAAWSLNRRVELRY